MVDTVDVQLTGLDSVLGKFGEISFDVKYKGGRSSLRKAAQLIKGRAKQNALQIDDPETAESIAENIVERFGGKRFKRTGDLMFRVGVLGGARSNSRDAQKARQRRSRAGIASLDELGEIAGAGKANPGGDTFHWRFVEFGTKRSRAFPFMRRALSENTQAATDEFIKEYDKALGRAIKRAKKAKSV